MKALCRVFSVLLVFLLAADALAAARIEVSNAWIPQAPPGAPMLAGYLTLANSGDTAVSLLAAESERFRTVSVHRTVIENGVSRMRELNRLEIAPGQEIKFAPGGMHLMLMQPRSEVVAGDRIQITFLLSDGQRVPAIFEVPAAEAATGDAHEQHH
ncbi:MAG TPA: copper chaperone PCu(A)C [Dokdonella sp.]|uniref:copper chaperone PCu(A)C n=1 Tax=Dokdonella sp. TaxID=2291710 RepID=UPI002BDD3A1B|nr:copper chaperone PCu(A)C [Dokdonella sp.]HOX72431.1 copper chaperone PCu(A)C [Dokdonella sp.]HPG93060.1 copper chaperone PCu(A)C [Dokdonella sp.]HPN80465.1 copper chaperone PCu(A)C [Dokdonella sp.]